MDRNTSPRSFQKRHLSFKRQLKRTLNDRSSPKLLKKPKQPSWATEMAINLGETIFKSGYSKLALLYPWRPGNVNVFSLWTDGRNACCLKFLHQRSRTHPPLVSNIQHADSSSRLPWSCFDTPVELFKLLQHCEANELWRLQSLRKGFSPPQRTNAAANVPLSLEMQPWRG